MVSPTNEFKIQFERMEVNDMTKVLKVLRVSEEKRQQFL